MKMWKRIMALMMAACLAAAMTGCSSGGESGNDQKTKEDAGEADSAPEEEGEASEEGGFEIAVTDDFTFTDPEDIEFDTRYVYYGDKNSIILSSYENIGINVDSVYIIFYAKDEAGLAEYQYYVFDDEESVESLADLLGAQGIDMEYDGLLGWCTKDGDLMESTIMTCSELDAISDATASAYTEIYTKSYGLWEYTEE